MGYDETLASKIHALLSAIGPCERSGAYGNVTFTVNGNIAGGVEDSNVFLRVGDARAADLLKIQGIKPYPAGGRGSRGWVLLTPVAIGPTIVLRERLGWAYAQTSTLTPKELPKQLQAAPKPAPPPPPPPEPPKKAAPRPPPKTPPPPPATTVIAPGMSRPLAPPTRIPFVPTVSKTVPPLTGARSPLGVPVRPRPEAPAPARSAKKARSSKPTKGTARPVKARPRKQRRIPGKSAKKTAAKLVRRRPAKKPVRKKAGKTRKR